MDAFRLLLEIILSFNLSGLLKTIYHFIPLWSCFRTFREIVELLSLYLHLYVRYLIDSIQMLIHQFS
jgi:hypothetical protein